MEYKYSYRTTASDLWQLTMYYTYGSIVGICNVIFTAAVLALSISKWKEAGDFLKGMMILGCCLFTVIQPLTFLNKAKKQASLITQDTTMQFDDTGIHIIVGDQESSIKWKSVKRISKKPTMVIIFADTTHGFVLTNRVLGKEKETFYQYLLSKIGTGK
ncbi:MAG: YcxB family protein [Lachnospiraceae bacterium]